MPHRGAAVQARRRPARRADQDGGATERYGGGTERDGVASGEAKAGGVGPRPSGP
jgi:hypothetical protein